MARSFHIYLRLSLWTYKRWPSLTTQRWRVLRTAPLAGPCGPTSAWIEMILDMSMQHNILQHVKKEALHLVAYSMSYSLLFVELDKLPRWTNCPGLLIRADGRGVYFTDCMWLRVACMSHTSGCFVLGYEARQVVDVTASQGSGMDTAWCVLYCSVPAWHVVNAGRIQEHAVQRHNRQVQHRSIF
jgi:hypothetical protein